MLPLIMTQAMSLAEEERLSTVDQWWEVKLTSLLSLWAKSNFGTHSVKKIIFG